MVKMTDYHNRIMNIPAGEGMPHENPSRTMYKTGHRDARHAAAEIAAEAEAAIHSLKAENEMLREALSAIVECWDGPNYKHVMFPNIEAARKALSAHDQGGE